MTRSPRSTWPPTPVCARLCGRGPARRPWSSWPSGCPRSPTPIRSSCWTTAGWPASARTTSCSRPARRTRRSSSPSTRWRPWHDRTPRTRAAGAPRCRGDPRMSRPSPTLDRPAGPPPRPAGPGFGRGPMAAMGMPAAKAMSFGPSARRLLGRLAPERGMIAGVVLLAITSVSLSVAGPRVLGAATDLIFAGILGRQLPAGLSTEQAAAAARAAGHGNVAGVITSNHVIPGRGIDFGALGTVLIWAIGLYAAASLFSWLQGYLLTTAVQRTVFRLRTDVEAKLHRLPLRYFDRQPRGDLLSRVTNDIDNIAQSLQQTLSQLLTSLLTVVGVIVLMLVISPLLAVIALVTIPISMAITTRIAKRSQKLFVAQWKHTGALNAHIEEAFTGHELVTVFGRQREVQQSFDERNEDLFRASFGAQFVSGLIMPAMMFL